jgi:hypothetical protein
MAVETLKKLTDEVINGILGTVYGVLDNNFECAAVCSPSYFALGSSNITTGPPERGCIFVFRDYIDFNFGKWGISLAVATFISFLLLGFSCCLFRKNPVRHD